MYIEKNYNNNNNNSNNNNNNNSNNNNNNSNKKNDKFFAYEMKMLQNPTSYSNIPEKNIIGPSVKR